MPDFIPGLRLSEIFYSEAVRPVLDAHFPGLEHSAALIGSGSDVLGYDSPISTDHHWGPRLLLFLSTRDLEEKGRAISRALSEHLPLKVRGFSTSFGPPDDIGVRLQKAVESGPVSHMVEFYSVPAYFESYLGIYPKTELEPLDWLTIPEQRLLTVTGGRVYHDGLGELEPVRARLSYYPRDVWLYLLAAQWGRIGEEEAFVGRSGDVGDELGSQVIAARLVRDIMKLCFLMERKYAPYSKWIGTAFSELECALLLAPTLRQVLLSEGWREREEHLSTAYSVIAQMHNELNITAVLKTEVSNYYSRPYLVINAARFVEAIRGAITDPAVAALPPGVGAVDQFIDSTVVQSRPELFRLSRVIFGEESTR